MLKTYLGSQNGSSTIYIVIIIMIVIFAVMFTGGSSHLLSGGTASTVTNTPTPSVDPSATATPAPDLDPNWSINASVSGCKDGKSPFKSAAISAKGTSNGYMALEIEDTPGNFIVKSTSEFKSPTWNFTATLPNDSSYNTKNWRLELYSGGTNSSDSWSGGTLKAKYDGQSTGC